MRRKDREITSREELEAILKASRILSLGLSGADGPYVVPLNYGYDAGKIFFHCAPEGRKLDMLNQNPSVAFSVVAEARIITGEKACAYTTDFCSVAGDGTARVLTSEKERKEGMDVLMRCHGGPEGPYDPAVFQRTAVVEIEVTGMTGKLKTSRAERPIL